MKKCQGEVVYCTLKCLRKALKQQHARNTANSVQRLAWDTDTPDGKYEGSSEAMLLDWLKTPSNYSFWKGNSIGTSKSEIQTKLANTINAEGMKLGIDRKRDGPSVGSKIRLSCTLRIPELLIFSVIVTELRYVSEFRPYY